MTNKAKNWYVLRAVSGKEAKVKEYIEAELKHNALLQSHVFQVLLPLEKHASLRNGKRVIKEKISWLRLRRGFSRRRCRLHAPVYA